ncbi:helix-turn-helix domain-containing protein [Metabacillus sp. 84]|uniref:helix-turn-helix domain-containing protein n=1 Tax=Metabacillus sp. 84 TaxID=3404705 RepID=UPI003CF31B72
MKYSLGFRLQLARRERGFSQKYMCQILKISAPTWSQYESDNKEPNLTKFRQIVKTLNVSADWLLGLTDHDANLKGGKKSAVPKTTKH